MTNLREIYFLCDVISDNERQDVYLEFYITDEYDVEIFKLHEVNYNEFKYKYHCKNIKLSEYQIYSDSIVDHFKIKTDSNDNITIKLYMNNKI